MTMNKIIPVFLLLLATTSGFAQIDNIDKLLSGGVDDANLLIQEYLRPFGNGFGTDLNNGWYSSAKTHSLLGFDLTVMASAAFSPESDQIFDIGELQLQNIELANPAGETETPTVVGDDVLGPSLNVVLTNPVTGQQEVVGSFDMPEGTGFSFVPSPMVQGSVGVFRGTDVMLRFFPEVEISSDLGKLRLFGLGVKHNINSWFPAGDFLPFDLAVMAAFTTFQAQSDLEVEPDPLAVQTGANYDDQQVEIEAKGMTFNVIASKQFAILTLFSSLGIEHSNVDLKLKGTYPVTIINVDPTSSNYGEEIIQDFEDPIGLSFDGANRYRLLIGAQLKLGFLAFQSAFSLSDYPVLTAGVGLHLR